MPHVGDMVFFSNLSHVGVIVKVLGNDPSQIYVVHASYNAYQIQMDTLEYFMGDASSVDFGHYGWE